MFTVIPVPTCSCAKVPAALALLSVRLSSVTLPTIAALSVLIEAVENALESQKQSFYKGVTGLLPIGKTGNL